MSDLKNVNEKIAAGITEGYEKIEEGVVTGYKKIETGVVDGYKKVETTVVEGFQKMTDKFVDKFLVKEGENLDDAKARLAENQKARIEASLEASRNAGKRN